MVWNEEIRLHLSQISGHEIKWQLLDTMTVIVLWGWGYMWEQYLGRNSFEAFTPEKLYFTLYDILNVQKFYCVTSVALGLCGWSVGQLVGCGIRDWIQGLMHAKQVYHWATLLRLEKRKWMKRERGLKNNGWICSKYIIMYENVSETHYYV